MIFSQLKTALHDAQYFHQKYRKKYIFLHHTAGGSIESTVGWWNSKPDRIATPYLIERDGTVAELYDPAFWAYALGVKGGTSMEKASIHIELAARGGLIEKNGQFISGASKVIPDEDVITFKDGYRGYKHFHKYTDAQISSLKGLLEYLIPKFEIKVENNLTNFHHYQEGKVFTLPSGIWSHTSVRKDKSDIIPQPELMKMLYDLRW